MTVSPAPHEWSLLSDFAKAAITLASSLLALGVAFADKLPAMRAFSMSWFLMQGSRFALVLATIGGVYLSAIVYGIAHREARLDEIAAALIKVSPTPTPAEKKLIEEQQKLQEEKPKYENAPQLVGNLTYLSLGTFAVLFGILGARVQASQSDAMVLAQRARKSFAKDRKLQPESFAYESIILAPTKESYQMLLRHTDGTAWNVDFATSDGHVTGFKPA